MKCLKLQTVRYFLLPFILAATLTACGGGGGGDSTTTSNVAPVASDIASGVNEGETIRINIAANVTDPENALDLASIAVIDAPINGTTQINTDGTVDYTHDGSETLADSFTYTMDDLKGSSSNLATVNVAITPVNDAPTISGTPATTVAEGALYSFTPLSGDVDGDTLLFSINPQPTWASFDTSTGALTGTPSANDLGTTTGIVITVDDQQGQPNSIANLPPFDLSVLQGFNEALYAEPTVSSSTSPERQYQANDGINTVIDNGWAATEDVTTETAWIRLTFDSTKSIYRVVLTDIIDLGTQTEAGLIEFSDGTSITFSTPLPDDGTPHEFVFSPKLTDWVKVTLTQASITYGLAELAAYSALDAGQTQQFEELFNDGDASGWMVVDTDCVNGKLSLWDPAFQFWSGAGNQYHQSSECGGYNIPQGVELGTYSRQTFVAPAAGIDLRLRLRSDDSGDTWVKGPMGVLFGYQDHDNYYRLDASQAEGHRKLWKKQAGVFTELNTSPQSYTPGSYIPEVEPISYSPEAWVNLRIVHQNGVILVYMNGEKIMAVEDTSFSGGQIALFCARNMSCSFDNAVLLGPTSAPILGLNLIDGPGHRSGEYFVTTGDSLDVSTLVSSSSGFDGVEFVLDEGTTGVVTQTVFVAPYEHQFTRLATGEHSIRGYLLDDSGQRLGYIGTEAADELPKVGAKGFHLVGLGDSITSGLLDDIGTDDTSIDGRNTSMGYPSVLNNLLTADNAGMPVTVLNEGNAGETSAEAVARISAVLARTPAAQAYLVIYGANDSGDGVTKAVFKANMQQLIDAVVGAGKKIYLGKTPPHMTHVASDELIQQYNDAIDELKDENGFSYTPPDFHTHFTENPDEMADDLHPNGVGYQSMAELWCSSLNGQSGMSCIP